VTTAALAGLRVVVTRPVRHAEELADAISAAGGRVIRFPVIDIVARDSDEVAGMLAAGATPDILIFVSRNAAAFGPPASSVTGASIAAIGPSTAAELKDAGFTVDIVPGSGFDSEHLLGHPALSDVSGKSITIVRGEDGRELMADTLRSRGANVSYLPVYERKPHVVDSQELSRLVQHFAQDEIDCVTVMSVATLENFLRLIPDSCREKMRKTLLVAPSERVIQTAKDLIPGAPTALASGPQVAAMVDALIAHKQSGQI
jgi:uroporphyrinogen-III synthase